MCTKKLSYAAGYQQCSSALVELREHTACTPTKDPDSFGGLGEEQFVGSMHALDFERAGEAELPQYSSDRQLALVREW